MTALRLYDLSRSGNCYKVRLLLAMLHLDYERVLADGETVIRDAMAIRVYLARRRPGYRREGRSQGFVFLVSSSRLSAPKGILCSKTVRRFSPGMSISGSGRPYE